MCGIAGFYSLTGQINQRDLHSMTECLQHRGPDADGFFVNESGTVGLGHRRLSIIDLSNAANQPMISSNDRYVIIFNGEVFNFLEIKKQLNIQPRTSSDTEIILEAFAQKGVEAVNLFNGMFAIIIYDKKEEALYFFRDRVGVKPLYYFSDGENFAFASEIKSLMLCPHVTKNIHLHKGAVSTFLYTGYIPGPYTIYDRIRQFPAGHYGVLKNGQFEIAPYWVAENKIAATVESNLGKAKQQLKELIISSVNYRMISDVPFGTFLSGGIDSSTITAVAQSISEKPVKTFTIGFKEDSYDESIYARKIARYLKTEHHEFIVSENDALELMDKMMTAYDQPYADSSSIPTMLVSKLARKYVTMTLSGDGGDELFLGYGAYTWARRLSNPLVKLFHGPLAFSLSQLSEKYRRGGGVFNYKTTRRIKSHIFSQEQYFFSEQELNNLLADKYKTGILLDENFDGLKRKLSPQEEQAFFDFKYYLKDDLLTKVDVATMQFSLEARNPLLDYRIVEFALNLNEKLKLKKGTTKYILKQILYEYIPPQYFDRPKWGFAIPLIKWLRNDLHYLIERYLNEETIISCGVVKFEKVKALRQRFEKGEDFLYNRLWALILLHKWMSEHARNAG
jgi:asparagine synthase (glutamine-hydrolysing)